MDTLFHSIGFYFSDIGKCKMLWETSYFQQLSFFKCFFNITISIHYKMSCLFSFVVSFLNSVSFHNCCKLWSALPIWKSYLC